MPDSASPSPIRYSEDWAAVRFTELHGENFRYVVNLKAWYVWEGGWFRDSSNTDLNDAIRQMCREIAAEARNDQSLNGSQRAQIAQRFSSGRIIHGIEIFLRSDPEHAFYLEKDAFPMNMPPPVQRSNA